MRATPPAARMSAGTRSSAMTATAPASSAILACSGVTTSMMTPPLSIWARPFLVAQVDVSTVMCLGLLWLTRARLAGRVWPRGRRPFESAGPRARLDYRTRPAKAASAGRGQRTDGPDDPRHQLGGAAGGGRRQPRQRIDEAEDVLVGQPAEQSDEAQDRRRRGPRPSRSSERSSSRGSSAGTRPTARSKRRTNDEERRQPVAQGGELRVVRVRGQRRRRLRGGPLEDGDDRVALAGLALGDDPAEPAAVVADREVGGAGRTAAADAAGLRDALDDAPRLGLGEGQARGPVAQAERLANLALGQRLLARHQVGLDAGDRRRDAPRGAHLAPRLGELEPDRLGGRRCAVASSGRPFESCAVAPRMKLAP